MSIFRGSRTLTLKRVAQFAVPVMAAIGLLFSNQMAVDSAGGTPVAVNDSAVIYENSATITINWIANDDMDDNAALDSFDAASTQGGTVSNNGDGTFDYTPPASFSGGDGFTYTICDDDTPVAECSTGSVSITIIATSTCVTGFYQTLSGEIHVLDTTTSPASYVSAATDIGELNATGYNPNDGLIYGFSSNLDEIVSYDINTGVFTNVFTHTEDAPFAGDFDGSNNLWYNRSSDTVMYYYNTVTDTRNSLTLPTSHNSSDFAYVPNDGVFYGVQSGGDNLAVIDVSDIMNPTVTTMATSGAITGESGGFGATWVTGNDTLFAFNNDSGNIFSINTSTGASTLVGTSSPNGSNDGMSCAAGTDPFSISNILDYGDAPDSYGTLAASSGASSVVNTSYRIGNFNEIDADGQPSSNADADDLDDVGDDEQGVRVGVDEITDSIIYEGQSNTVSVDVPLNNGFVSMWIDLNDDGDFDSGEQVADDVAPTGGVATLTFTPPNAGNSQFTTYARVRLAAREGATATGLFSFGEVEDYLITMNPSPPTISNGALDPISSTNVTSYTASGSCTDDGDSVSVAFSDGSTTITPTAVNCASGMFSVTANLSSMNEGSVTITSTIDDGVNPTVNDADTVTKDATAPTITQTNPGNITVANETSYDVSGTCTADGDAITVTATDSATPTANTVSDTTTCGSGTYMVTLNTGALVDGSVTVESEIDDTINPAVTDDDSVTKDSVAPTITQAALANITAANETSFPVSGTCTADGDSITITATDSATPTANTASTTTSCSSGTYSTTLNVSGLDNGSVNVESEIDDGVNPAVTDDADTTMDGDLPTITQATLDEITNANEATFFVSGSCTADGDTITVTATDTATPTANTATDTTTCSSGMYTATLDTTGLEEGSINVESSIDDGVNPAVTDDADTTKDSILPTIMVDALPAITTDNITAYPVSVTCTADGDDITITATDTATPMNSVGFATNCSGGVAAATLDISSFESGTITITGDITDGTNPTVTDTQAVILASDLDDDDTSAEVEKAGPNNGDGNNDGTPDFLQTDVTTKVNPQVSGYTTTAATGGTCTDIDAVTFFAETDLAVADDDYEYALGLHGFEVDCLAPGGTVDVTFYWDKEYDTSEWNYRKFIAARNEYVDFNDQVTYGTASIGGNTVTTVSFSVTDGGEFDSDGIANGVIVDPAGPTNTLANTGSAAQYSIALGLAVLALSSASYAVSRRNR